jgi:lipopolysaccharide/colanic/teichoic acid biosynthesis glycosyltransferase
VEIQHELMSVGQRLAKRIFDLLFALLAMVLLSPIMLLCALMVRFSSPGPIFFLQDRIGLNGRSFRIIKFRSMIANAEANGPQLSSENDSRITGWGRLMRKYRLDELPQIFNVLAGDMSVVGPRPERAYYIERIKETAPHFVHLQKVRPGITSWGMVKFGYAENVEEMVQRVKYDIIYIENMNFLNDLKVLIYTVLIVLQGRGK